MASADTVARLVLAGLLATAAAIACGGGTTSAPAGSASAQPPRRTARTAPSASADAGVAGATPPPLDFQEYEFGESERSRDPFRPYGDYFLAQAKSRVESQREVLLDEYALEELRLIGIVQRSDPPLAMLVDPTGKGHTIKRGQFVGRPEVVQSPGQRGAAYELNWRVERIRDGDVVFVREDPQNPDVPSATKVIELHTEETLEGEP
ncbi:MAG: pilus assembly protein PilP [Polyangiaceae bacterium]|nr:pilus assembly protein PilP [Polyangiaceae bacterium]